MHRTLDSKQSFLDKNSIIGGTSLVYSINHLKTADGALYGQVLSKGILLHIAARITVTPNSGMYNLHTKKKKCSKHIRSCDLLPPTHKAKPKQ